LKTERKRLAGRKKKVPPVFIGCRISCGDGFFLDGEKCPQRDKCPCGSSYGRRWFAYHNGVRKD
jgi:hypothetical protein